VVDVTSAEDIVVVATIVALIEATGETPTRIIVDNMVTTRGLLHLDVSSRPETRICVPC